MLERYYSSDHILLTVDRRVLDSDRRRQMERLKILAKETGFLYDPREDILEQLVDLYEKILIEFGHLRV